MPMLGLDPQFREMAMTTEECRQSAVYSNECPFGKHLDDIMASSKKLQWLQNFIKTLGTAIDPDTGYEYPENQGTNIHRRSSSLLGFRLWLILFGWYAVCCNNEGRTACVD
jgi:hypothetical protein